MIHIKLLVKRTSLIIQKAIKKLLSKISIKTYLNSLEISKELSTSITFKFIVTGLIFSNLDISNAIKILHNNSIESKKSSLEVVLKLSKLNHPPLEVVKLTKLKYYSNLSKN